MIDPSQDPEFRDMLQAAQNEANSSMRMLAYAMIWCALIMLGLIIYMLVRWM